MKRKGADPELEMRTNLMINLMGPLVVTAPVVVVVDSNYLSDHQSQQNPSVQDSQQAGDKGGYHTKSSGQ